MRWNLRIAALFVLGFALSPGACNTSVRGSLDGEADMSLDPGGPLDMTLNADAFWADDPPPKMCTLEGGMFPPPMVPGGTPECPDDKNREGCPCPKDVKPGDKVACWPGLRANRNLGICKDGEARCIAGEVQNVLGPCEGYVLPVPGAAGKEACQCFSSGLWELANTSPCFIDTGGGLGSGGAVSTILVAGKAQCPGGTTKPTQPWSPNTVEVDCAGRFELCYTLKAGKADMPKASDCTVIKVCTKGDYTKVGETQSFPALPSWITTTNEEKACAKTFVAIGGYGEMSVNGLSVGCDQVGPKVFNRIQYCPFKCNNEAHKMDPECINCRNGGSGRF